MSILDKASLIQIPSGYKSTKLYSLRPSNGDGDFTFSRSSSATRVNSEGLIETASVLGSELVTNGDFATDSDWTLGNGWFISGGKAILVDGLDPTYQIYQVISGLNTKNLKVTFDVTDFSGNAELRYPFRENITGNGSYTFYGVGTFDRVQFQVKPGFTASFSIDNVSVNEVFENDVPRLDYSGGASCASLLLEPQRTNQLLYSEEFDNAYWTKNTATITPNTTTSPDGYQNADTLNLTTTASRVQRNILLGAGTYTTSIYVKIISGSGDVRILAVVDSSAVEQVFTPTNDWQRVSLTFTAATSVTDVQFRSNGFVGDLAIYGAQLEQGSYPTSYIPTTSSTVTRTADVCNNAGTSATFNDSEGVLFWDGYIPNDGNEKILQISDGTNNNVVRIFARANGNDVRFQIIVGGVNSFSQEIPMSSNNIYKTSLKYKENDIAIWVNGFELYNANSGSMPSNLNTLEFNSDGDANTFYGKTKQLMVFNEALSDEELSDLTGQVNLSFNNLATFYGYNIL